MIAWVKKYAAVITILFVIVGAAATYGATVRELGQAVDAVDNLKATVTKITSILVELRVVTGVDTERIDGLESALEEGEERRQERDRLLRRLELAVTRLEALQGVKP